MSENAVEKIRRITVSTNRQVYYLDLSTVKFITNGEEGESLIISEFIDKNDDTGTIFLSPTFKIHSVQYNLPF